MNILLIFFALPIATIIISIALQKILKCPVLVAAVIFAIFLIVTFIINNLTFLVAAIVYAIISFITAILTYIICRFLNTYHNNNCCRDNNYNCNCNNTQNDLLTISSNCRNNGNGELLTISSNGCGNTNELLTISSNNNRNENRNCNCNCNNNNCDNNCSCNCCSDNNTINFANGVSARINVIPNNNNNGQTGCISGCYRRR